MKIDLHTHSRCSDGSLTVEELVRAAAENEVVVLSLTDHDNIDGTCRAIACGAAHNIDVIPGIEISAWDPSAQRKVHILGYGYRSDASAITDLCTPLLRRRHARTLEQIQLISSAGYELSERDVRKEAGQSQYLYKQHIMAVLVQKGYADSIYSGLYRELFKGEGVAAGDIEYVHYADAIAAVLDDGGIPVLAHPGQQRSFDLIRVMIQLGLRGIEVYHPDHSREDVETACAYAENFDLLKTGGTDFHGTYGVEVELGSISAPRSFVKNWKECLVSVRNEYSLLRK